jgi:hypothetical protein
MTPFVLLLSFETGSLYEASVGLELAILLPLPSECWNYRPSLSSLDHESIFIRKKYACPTNYQPGFLWVMSLGDLYFIVYTNLYFLQYTYVA